MSNLCRNCGFEGEYPSSCEPCRSCRGWEKPAPTRRELVQARWDARRERMERDKRAAAPSVKLHPLFQGILDSYVRRVNPAASRAGE